MNWSSASGEAAYISRANGIGAGRRADAALRRAEQLQSRIELMQRALIGWLRVIDRLKANRCAARSYISQDIAQNIHMPLLDVRRGKHC